MRTVKKEINLMHTLILSSIIHFLCVSPLNQYFFKMYFPVIPDKEDLIEIKFEFFQAAPKDPKELFLPRNYKNILLPDNQPVLENFVNDALKGDVFILSEHSPGQKLEFEFEEPEPQELELTPSLEEQELIEKTDEKISDSLKTKIDLEEKEKKEIETIKWDYCNRIRTLIENHSKFPESLSSKRIIDIVKIEITLNREGKLIKGTPIIIRNEASKYSEINKAAISATIAASKQFPPLPKRYKQNEITFLLPVKFISEEAEKYFNH